LQGTHKRGVGWRKIQAGNPSPAWGPGVVLVGGYKKSKGWGKKGIGKKGPAVSKEGSRERKKRTQAARLIRISKEY